MWVLECVGGEGVEKRVDTCCAHIVICVWLIVSRESGCGKTSLLAKAAAILSAKERRAGSGTRILLRFLGTSASSYNVVDLLTSLCEQLAAVYPDKAADCAMPEGGSVLKLSEELFERMAWASSEEPLVLFLDSLDQLSDANNGRALGWLPLEKLPANVRLVLSTLPEEGGCLDALRSQVSSKKVAVYEEEVQPLTAEDVAAVLDAAQERAGRTLLQEDRELIRAKFKGCPLPLYLTLAAGEALRWRSDTPKEERQLADTVQGLIVGIFERLEHYHGEILVGRALAYLTAAKHGLSASNMADALSRRRSFAERVRVVAAACASHSPSAVDAPAERPAGLRGGKGLLRHHRLLVVPQAVLARGREEVPTFV